MRSSVDFPQPDGPRMVTKSFSATLVVIGVSASVGAPPRTPPKVRPTCAISTALMPGSTETGGDWLP